MPAHNIKLMCVIYFKGSSNLNILLKPVVCACCNNLLLDRVINLIFGLYLLLVFICSLDMITTNQKQVSNQGTGQCKLTVSVN